MSIEEIEDAILRWLVRLLSRRGRRFNQRSTIAVLVITFFVLLLHYYLGCVHNCDNPVGKYCVVDCSDKNMSYGPICMITWF